MFKNNRQLLGCKMKEIQVVSKNFRGTKTNCQGEKMTDGRVPQSKRQPFTIIITAIVYTAPSAKAISN